MEGLPIAGRTADSTAVSGRFPVVVGNAFPASLISVALLPNVTFTPSSVGGQDSYHE